MEELASEIVTAIAEDNPGRGYELMAKLLDRFDNHVAAEEAGLFRQLADAGEASEQLSRLKSDHRALRRELSSAVLEDPGGVRRPLGHLCQHADTEDTDLFRFAHQVLSDRRWASLGGHPHGRAHQEMSKGQNGGPPSGLGGEHSWPD